MSNNFIRVLRNTDLCANHEAAIEKLQGKLANLQDGEICIASYGDDWGTAKSILGVVRAKIVGDTTKRSYTIFDNEDTADILAAIQKLDATKDVTSTDGHVTVKVVQEDGLLKTLEVKTDNIAKATELGTKDDASTVDTAFGRIKKEVEERGAAITKAIADLHSVVTPTNDHSVLTGLTQENGVLTAKTEITLANVAITGSAADVANAAIAGGESQVAVNGTNVKDQISSIATTLKGVQNSIAAVEANALKYITHKLTTDEVTALGDSNVKDAYQVFAYTGTWNSTTNKGTQVGDTIKIYKDATIHEIYLGDKDDTITEGGDYTRNTGTIPEADLSLNYVYINEEGKYAMVHIPVGNFLREAEFQNGLQVVNGEVSVKVDTTSEGAENFLSVGQNGVKISGVQNAINSKIADLHADVTGKSTDDHVTVQVIETAGKVTNVNVTTSGLALASDVIKGVTVNGADAQVSADRKAIVTINGANTAVSDAYAATKYAEPFEKKVGTNHIAAGDTVDAAFKKTENTISVLATEVISNEKVTTAAITELAKSTGVTNTDGVIKYTPKDGANYIGAATSVHDATVKLDGAIKAVDTKITTLEGNALTSVVAGDGIEVSTKASNSQTVSLKLKEAADNALTVDTNGLYLSNVWDCGTY